MRLRSDLSSTRHLSLMNIILYLLFNNTAAAGVSNFKTTFLIYGLKGTNPTNLIDVFKYAGLILNNDVFKQCISS